MKETRLKGALFHLCNTLVRKKTTGIKKKNKKRPVVARGRNGARYCLIKDTGEFFADEGIVI